MPQPEPRVVAGIIPGNRVPTGQIRENRYLMNNGYGDNSRARNRGHSQPKAHSQPKSLNAFRNDTNAHTGTQNTEAVIGETIVVKK